MGLSSGKLTLHPVHHDKTKAETNDTGAHKPKDTVETASQLVNGDATAMSNVPAIDDVVPEQTPVKLVGAARTEVIESVDDTPGPNGTVAAGESSSAPEVEKKKTKNPLGWIKRRLSKKSSTEGESAHHEPVAESGDVSKGTTEAAAPAPSSQEPQTPSVPSAQVTETAETLVDDILSSAMATESEKVAAEPEPTQEAAEAHEMPAPAEESHTEPTDEVQTQDVVSSHVEPEDKPPQEENAEETAPVVDTNNTNVAAEESYNQSDMPPTDEDVQETVSTKLAELELTNGHPEQPTPTENGHETEHHEGMMNGE